MPRRYLVLPDRGTAVAASCGLLLIHGAPDASLERLEDLDALSLTGEGNDERQEEGSRHHDRLDRLDRFRYVLGAAEPLPLVCVVDPGYSFSSDSIPGTSTKISRTCMAFKQFPDAPHFQPVRGTPLGIPLAERVPHRAST
jgi:hypothetical protein